MTIDQTSIRNTTHKDINKVMSIYEYASIRMKVSGNPNQWIDGYPSQEIVTRDIERGDSYVIECDGKIIGVFSFIIGNDPTYETIDGQWLNENRYGTIHRIASAPDAKGIADICLRYCKSKTRDIRIDTHKDNTPMLGWIQSRGFEYCGTIVCDNGTLRLAFHLSLNS